LITFFSKAKYTVNNVIVIVAYEILYNMYTKFEVKMIPLYNSIKI